MLPWDLAPAGLHRPVPSESLPASYGPGAGMLVRAVIPPPLCPICAPCGLSTLAPTGAASPNVPLRASRSATAPEQGLWCDPRLCCFCVSPEGDGMV